MGLFGCFFFVFRSVATLILFVVIGLAFIAFLLVDNLRNNSLDDQFYTENLLENDVYNRIYDEVLPDPEFKDKTDELLGNIDVPHDDVASVARKIITPDYLQDQVEQAIRGTIDYLNKDTDIPEVFIELGPPLDRVRDEIFVYIDGRIDGLEDVPVSSVEELQAELEEIYRTLEDGKIPTSAPLIEDPDALVASYVDDTIADLTVIPADTAEDFEREIEGIYQRLADGQLPTSIPSIQSIPVDQRLAAYDLALADVRAQGLVPEESLDKLREQEEEIKAQLREADVKGALSVASRPLTEPVLNEFVDDAYDLAFEALEKQGFSQDALDGLERRSDEIKELLGAGNVKGALKTGARGITNSLIDEAIQDLRSRKEVDDQDRLDLIAVAAEQNHQTKEEFLDDVDVLRDVIGRSYIGGCAAVLILALAVVGMFLVWLPHIGSGLRWPGVTLFLTGLAFLIIGVISKSKLSDWFEDLLDEGIAGTSPIPDSMIVIMNDVLGSMATDIAGGFIVPSIAILVIGLVLLIGSFFVRMLHIPILSR